MKKNTLVLALLTVASVVSADVYIPNGDFEDGNTGWSEADGGGTTTYAYETTGGSTLGAPGGGYATIDNAGGWAVLVNPAEAGTNGGGIAIADLGVTAGTTETFTIDLKTFSGTAGGGMKVEAWATNTLQDTSGDINAPTAYADWTTFTFDWKVPAGTEKLIFVPLWGADSVVGFDNVGVKKVVENPVLPFSLSSSIVGNEIRISFPAQSGISYQVVYKDSLMDLNWVPVEMIVGDGLTNTVSYEVSSSFGFYTITVP